MHCPEPHRSRLTACALAVIGCALLSTGCLSLSVGNWTTRPSDDASVLAQSGRAWVAKGQVADIYYPVPYASAPNIDLESDVFHNYEIIDQKPDHFRLRNNNATFDVNWVARGVRAAPPTIIVQPTTVVNP